MPLLFPPQCEPLPCCQPLVSRLFSCSSCKAVVEAQQWVSLVPEAIQAYAAQLDAAAVRAGSAKAGLMFPIKFDSQEAEVCAGMGVRGRIELRTFVGMWK